MASGEQFKNAEMNRRDGSSCTREFMEKLVRSWKARVNENKENVRY